MLGNASLRLIAAVVTIVVTSAAVNAAHWALVTVPMAPMRSAAAHSSEMETQYIMGTPVRVDSVTVDWAYATGPDGYRGYLPLKALAETDSAGLCKWQQSQRYIVVNPSGLQLRDSAGMLISPLPFGAIVGAADSRGAVSLPDGRTGYTEAEDIVPLETLGDRSVMTPDMVVDMALAFTGVPYLWGGTTADALDCSGLTQLSYKMAGLMLPRNASAQARIGKDIALDVDSLRPADLIFMGSDRMARRVTHVGIYLGNGMVIHSSGYVHVNSLYPASPQYINRVLLGARRYFDGTAGPLPDAGVCILSHPWYFAQGGTLALPRLLIQ